MKHPQEHHYCALRKLTQLPERMVVAHEYENLAEFILHELLDPSCFPCTKAAFFVDNPDFNCLKGVAGVSTCERFPTECVWDVHEQFTCHMKQASFNTLVRSVMLKSCTQAKIPWKNQAADLADSLALEGHELCVFPIKHGNTGLLIFESHEMPQEVHDCLTAGIALLGLCPVF